MTIQKLNLGAPITGEGGDSYREANNKINDNFDILKSSLSSSSEFNVQQFINKDHTVDRHYLTRRGAGAYNVPQDFTVDHLTDELYTLHVSGTPSLSAINKFNATAVTQTSIRYLKTLDARIGHQGLGVCRDRNASRWFVSAAGDGITDKGGKCVIYKISDDETDIDGLVVSDFRTVTLHNTAIDQICTTGVSIGGNYLISKTNISNTATTIRVHDLQKILNNPSISDFSNDYINEFVIYNQNFADYPIQGIACDNKLIYIFMGYGVAKNTDLIASCYGMSGNKIYEGIFEIGKAKALTEGDGNMYEFEGADWCYVGDRPILSVMIASGALGARRARIYQLSGNTSITAVVRGDNRPAFIADATNDFGVPKNAVLRMGRYDSEANEFEESMSIAVDDNISFSDKNSGALIVTARDLFNGGNESITKGTGNFYRIGKLIFINIEIRNINISGMTANNNLYLTLDAGANKNFVAVASKETIISFHYHNYTPGVEVTHSHAMVGDNGTLKVVEAISGANYQIADVSQFSNATIFMSGCYLVA